MHADRWAIVRCRWQLRLDVLLAEIGRRRHRLHLLHALVLVQPPQNLPETSPCVGLEKRPQDVLHELSACRKRNFLSAFPMFAPSLSRKTDRSCIIGARKAFFRTERVPDVINQNDPRLCRKTYPRFVQQSSSMFDSSLSWEINQVSSLKRTDDVHITRQQIFSSRYFPLPHLAEEHSRQRDRD